MRTERSQIYKCKHCGQVVEILDGGMNPVCCGESMTLQPANTVEASREKHIPVIEVQDNGILVKIGRGEQEHITLGEGYVSAVQRLDASASRYVYQQEMIMPVQCRGGVTLRLVGVADILLQLPSRRN